MAGSTPQSVTGSEKTYMTNLNRTDLALGFDAVHWADDADAEWIVRHGRYLRRRARESRECTLRYHSTPISVRIRGWRRHGLRHGHSFKRWSPWIQDYRGQLHLAVLRGSEFAVRQLSQALVDDVTEAA